MQAKPTQINPSQIATTGQTLNSFVGARSLEKRPPETYPKTDSDSGSDLDSDPIPESDHTHARLGIYQALTIYSIQIIAQHTSECS
jgi:hypothetical protein